VGNAAGYFWDASENGLWDWKNNTAHTNNDYGIRTWQNNGRQINKLGALYVFAFTVKKPVLQLPTPTVVVQPPFVGVLTETDVNT